MAQVFSQGGRSKQRLIRDLPGRISRILTVALMLVTGICPAQESRTEAHDCASVLRAITGYLTSGSAIPRTISSQCADRVLQAEFLVPAELEEFDLTPLLEIVKDPNRFFGLAEFYSGASLNILAENGNITDAVDGSVIEGGSWLAVAGRYEVLGLSASGATLSVSEEHTLLQWPSGPEANVRFVYGEKELVAAAESVFDATRYAHLWGWLATLSKWVELMLEQIHAATSLGWGWSVALLAVVLKILLLPVSIMTVRSQRKVSNYQRILEPEIREIKAQYDGEQAHNRIMDVHKNLGITPFFTLKPMLGLFVQIPVLIAVFNALGEMPQLVGARFMWIESLAYPDAVATLPFAIPMLGDTINILPVLMTLVTLFATITFRNRVAPDSVVKAQKTQLYLMAAAFFVLFYSFPAAMVWYWTATNGLQLVQQRVLKI